MNVTIEVPHLIKICLKSISFLNKESKREMGWKKKRKLTTNIRLRMRRRKKNAIKGSNESFCAPTITLNDEEKQRKKKYSRFRKNEKLYIQSIRLRRIKHPYHHGTQIDRRGTNRNKSQKYNAI